MDDFTDANLAIYTRRLDIYIEEMRNNEVKRYGEQGVMNADDNRLPGSIQTIVEEDSHDADGQDGGHKVAYSALNETPQGLYDGEHGRSGAISGQKRSHLVPPPDPKDRRLSDLIRENWETGRFWFHDIMLSSFIGAHDTSWRRLTELYPYMAQCDIDEADLDAFVKRKLKDRQEYDLGYKEIKLKFDQWIASDLDKAEDKDTEPSKEYAQDAEEGGPV